LGRIGPNPENRHLLLVAALMTQRPPPLVVLNETGLHPDRAARPPDRKGVAAKPAHRRDTRRGAGRYLARQRGL
jgi:hypothetical protein